MNCPEELKKLSKEEKGPNSVKKQIALWRVEKSTPTKETQVPRLFFQKTRTNLTLLFICVSDHFIR